MKKLMFLALIAALVLPVVGCKKKEPTLESIAADAQKAGEDLKKDAEKVKVELPKE
ncbi:MAG TPA: hypothetical protein PLE35_04765 [Lentisphaeria bacterium]|nr:hypothetical protein [Lentisphaeria bacterium]